MSKDKEVPQLVDAEKVNMIFDSIRKSSHSDFVKKRQMVMIELLAFSGARTSELECLSIDSVKYSSHSSQAMIKLPAFKLYKGAYKFVLIEISVSFAQELLKFIVNDRNRIISETCGIKKDTGALLINEKTGLRLSSRDLSQEISKILKATGIDIKTSAILFRQQDSSLSGRKLHSLNSDKEYELSVADQLRHVDRYMSKYYEDQPTEFVIDSHLLDNINLI